MGESDRFAGHGFKFVGNAASDDELLFSNAGVALNRGLADAETKEQLGGYYPIDGRNLDAALEC